MTDKTLIELGYRHGVEIRDIAQDGLESLARKDLDACRKALLAVLASVDRFNRVLFASGPMQEGNARASALEAQGVLYGVLADNADELLRMEEARQRQMYGDGVQ